MVSVSADGRAVLDALERFPAGRILRAAGAEISGAHLVGGAVRDLLLDRSPRELDVVVEGDPTELIELLVRGGGGDRESAVAEHARFGTASVRLGGGRVDIARSRRERYARPGALPEVEPAPLHEDLLRRDFTINAIAVRLRDGEVEAAPSALEDLSAGLLRVLHDASFRDDPTRLLRLVRLRVRLGFTVEEHTAELAGGGDLSTVSGARIGAELRLALAEPDPIAALAALAELPDLPLDVDRDLLGRASALLVDDGRVDLMLLAAVTRGRADPAWLAGLGLTATEREIVLAGWEAGPLARAIAAAASPSDLYARLARQPVEAVALAGALGPAAAAGRWLKDLRHVSLEIEGSDLIAAGIAPGPELGQRLERTLARKLDGDVGGGRRAELISALSNPEDEPPAGERRIVGPERRGVGRRPR
jgi:tRNA nucleotidyltransferase (CCA-adding enzyme)